MLPYCLIAETSGHVLLFMILFGTPARSKVVYVTHVLLDMTAQNKCVRMEMTHLQQDRYIRIYVRKCMRCVWCTSSICRLY